LGCGAVFLFALVLAQTATAQSPPYDLLPRNARIVDGSGEQAYRGDVAIGGDTIVGVAPMIEGRAARVIDVRGQVLAPGFTGRRNNDRGL
jgi:adenine deaminase